MEFVGLFFERINVKQAKNVSVDLNDCSGVFLLQIGYEA